MSESYDLYKAFFKAFSNQTRLEIIQILRKKPLTVTEICEKTGFEQSRVSHNLKCLENCGFVNVKKKGKFREYGLDEETFVPLLKFLDKHIERYKEKIEVCQQCYNTSN